MNIQEKLNKINLTLPPAPKKGGLYNSTREFGTHLLYLSGCGPNIEGEEVFSGKLGGEYTLEDGQRAAVMTTLNALAVMQDALGDLGRVKKIVKTLCFVASENDFYRQPEVANAASQLLINVFGEEVGLGARSAIGVNVLPGNIPFEIELVVELHE